MKRIDATIYFGFDGARKQTTIWVEDNTTTVEIEEQLREEALNEIEFEWHVARGLSGNEEQ